MLALVAGRGRRNRAVLIVVGLVVGVIVVGELFSIGGSLLNKARSAPTATPLVQAAAITGTKVTLVPSTPTPTPTQAPDFNTAGTPLPTFTPMPQPTSAPTVVPLFQSVGDRSIYIPKLQLPGAVPIIDLPLVNQTWDVRTLGHNVGHLDATGWLGTTGNTVLVAHIQLNFQDMGPFQHLNQLGIGDQIMVADKGHYYVYQVTSVKTVDPTAVEVTYPTVDPILTLITCTVWDAHQGVFAKRLVVTAKLTQAPPQQAA